MLQVFVVWLYISFISVILGSFVLGKLYQLAKLDVKIEFTHAWVAGLVITTVYAQYFSLFAGVSAVAQILLLAVTCVVAFVDRKRFASSIQNMRKALTKDKVWFIILSIGIILVCAFFTSRGKQHGDTGLYHSQVIRWIEELGVVKGLGNLFTNYAYNSSWHCYCALFSFAFLGGQSLHTGNGLIMLIMCIYAIKNLLSWKEHKYHYADAARLAILFYSLNICVVAMSPATDAPAMYLILYVMLRWLERMEEERNTVFQDALICMAAVFTVTVKLSSGALLLFILYPVIHYMKQKKWNMIGLFFGIACLISIPFFARNIILSGWLVYPFEAIDLFDVEWKIPLKTLVNDSNQITTYGRKTFDPQLADQSFSEWFPVWWKVSETYDNMLFLAQLISVALLGIHLLKKMVHKEKINGKLFLLDGISILGIVMWLFSAPFVRYNLGFLLLLPILAMMHFKEDKYISLYKICGIGCIVGILTCLAPFWNHYMNDTLLFVKENASAPYYIVQKDYDRFERAELVVDGVTFYIPANGENMGYDAFPGICGFNRNFRLLGTDIADGFAAEITEE